MPEKLKNRVANLTKLGIVTILPFYAVLQVSAGILNLFPELKNNNREIVTPFVKELISKLKQ